METNQGKKFGYARVSTTAQNEDRQIDLLTQHYGIPPEDIFVDKASGAKADREALNQLQLVLRPGDTVYVESLSRLSRSSWDLTKLLSEWQEKGITLVSHKEKVDCSTPNGKLFVNLLIALTEFERETIRARIRHGIAAARARGRVGGRKKTDKRKIEKAIRLYEARTHSIREICELCEISKTVLYRELKSRREQMELASAEGGH
ncbi:recombinase family protein [Paenibacillus sp. DYY-L-2]|uniref:recombinase family protein n=1 Tax=Paenibacillus sp. DYY-L-2 TaxID=3447013 RepID=UPI003F4FE095